MGAESFGDAWAGWGAGWVGCGGCEADDGCFESVLESDLLCPLAALFIQEAKPDMVGELGKEVWVRQGRAKDLVTDIRAR